MHKNLLRYLAMITGAMALVLSSCKKEGYDNTQREPLELSRSSIRVGNEPETIYIGVTARNTSWTVTGDEAWCRLASTSGDVGTKQIAVNFLENNEGSNRETTFVFISGEVRKEISVEQITEKITNPNQDPEFEINKKIHEDIINSWYYWNSETRKIRADYNQPYKSFCENYLAYLDNNSMDGNMWTNYNQRYLYSYIEKSSVTAAPGITPLNYGMEFDIKEYDGKFTARILYVLDGSPAAKAGLKRGDWFYKINDSLMSRWNYHKSRIDTLINPIADDRIKLSMLTFTSYAGTLTDNGRSVIITPENHVGNSILNSSVITQYRAGQLISPTGYLAYNSFDPNSENQLISIFERFKTAGITSLVVDLRYNKSGTVEMAELMGNLIAPESMRGEPFARYEFNSDQGLNNRRATFQPHASGVGVESLYILVTRHTAGAAELLINAFRKTGDYKLVLIGEKTEGMNMGMVRRRYNTNDYRYDMYPVAFRCYDPKEMSGYQFGIQPNVDVKIWNGDNLRWRETFEWKGTVGAVEDPLLKIAMDIIAGNTQPPTASILDATSASNDGFPRDFSIQRSMIMDNISE